MIALLFPGQGSQFVGMGQSLLDNCAVAKQTFEEANDVLQFDLTGMCLSGDLDELTLTMNAQPALLTVSVAAYRVYLQEIGVTPAYAAGHSLGEFSALTAAGALRFADALQIVRKRGQLMQETVSQGTGVMTAVGRVAREVVEAAVQSASTAEQPAAVACYNAQEQLVISGHHAAVKRVEEILEGQGAYLTSLKVSSAFHSPLMAPAAAKLREYLATFAFAAPNTAVLSNVTASPYSQADDPVDLLTRQMTEPVRWQESMQFLHRQGVKKVVELGSKQVLQGLMKKNAPSVAAYTLGEAQEVEPLKTAFAAEMYVPSFLGKCLAIAVATKNRNDDDAQYQSGMIEPYRRIKQLHLALEEEGKEPTNEQMLAGLEMLHSVFAAKKAPQPERDRRISELLRVTRTESLLAAYVS